MGRTITPYEDELPQGSHILAGTGPAYHHGILLLNGDVCHFVGPDSSLADVTITSLAAFQLGRPLSNVSYAVALPFSRVQIEARARAAVGTMLGTYDILKNNSEQFVVKILTGNGHRTHDDRRLLQMMGLFPFIGVVPFNFQATQTYNPLTAPAVFVATAGALIAGKGAGVIAATALPTMGAPLILAMPVVGVGVIVGVASKTVGATNVTTACSSGAAMGGMVVGASLGSVVPILGTAMGAAGGAFCGVIFGWVKS